MVIVCTVCLFLAFFFQPICVFEFKVCLSYTKDTWVLVFLSCLTISAFCLACLDFHIECNYCYGGFTFAVCYLFSTSTVFFLFYCLFLCQILFTVLFRILYQFYFTIFSGCCKDYNIHFIYHNLLQINTNSIPMKCRNSAPPKLHSFCPITVIYMLHLYINPTVQCINYCLIQSHEFFKVQKKNEKNIFSLFY